MPTITSVAPTITGLSPRPSSANQRIVSLRLESSPIRDRPNSATADISMPATIGTRGPVLVMSSPDSGEPTISMPVIGSSRTPVATGSRPCTFSMKNVMKNIAPNIANISVSTRTVPADSGTDRNSRSGSSGSFALDSRTMKAMSATTRRRRRRSSWPDVQP